MMSHEQYQSGEVQRLLAARWVEEWRFGVTDIPEIFSCVLIKI